MAIPPPMRQRGFTMVELIIAIALALTLTIAGTLALNKVQDLSYVIAQRSDMQENARSAFNFLATDISLAGTGMPVGGVALPAFTIPANAPTYGSAFSICCNTFLLDASNHPFLYSAEGGWSYPPHLGPDYKPEPLITLTYVDSVVSMLGGAANATCAQPPMVLDQYNVTITDIAQGAQITFSNCTNIADPADPANALKIGDALLVCDGTCAAGVITALPGANAVQLVSGDPLNFNQPSAATGNIQALKVSGAYPPGATATRIKIVTYYLDPSSGPDGLKGTADDGPPFRLMRRVNAGSAVVLAENILDMQVSYDLYDDSNSSAQDAGEQNPARITPGLIRNVNLFLTVRSPLPNRNGAYQGISLATSVAPRNLSYQNRYQ